MREIMLILHFIGLVMGLGTAFAHAFLGIAAAKMTHKEAISFRLKTLVLSKMGNMGVALLILSGFYLITPYWTTLAAQPLLILKLVLVAILIILILMLNIASKKASQGDAENQLSKMELLGKSTLIIGLLIVILAVKVFH